MSGNADARPLQAEWGRVLVGPHCKGTSTEDAGTGRKAGLGHQFVTDTETGYGHRLIWPTD